MVSGSGIRTCKCGNIYIPRYINALLISRDCPECTRNKLKRSKNPINKVSAKQADKNSELAKIKKSLPDICAIMNCCTVGTKFDLCHLLPKGPYPEHYLKRENLVKMCRLHHRLFDDYKEFRQLQTNLYEQVKTFDEIAANKYFQL